MDKPVFVFGSNLAGVHGAGAAKFALQNRGAIWGYGVGHFGDSYALPTKDRRLDTLHMNLVQVYVRQFLYYAKEHPAHTFQVTRVGCGLAGLQDADMAPLFKDAPDNCHFDTAWLPWLPGKTFWGTF